MEYLSPRRPLLDWDGWTFASAGTPPAPGTRCRVRFRESGAFGQGDEIAELTLTNQVNGWTGRDGQSRLDAEVLGWKPVTTARPVRPPGWYLRQSPEEYLAQTPGGPLAQLARRMLGIEE